MSLPCVSIRGRDLAHRRAPESDVALCGAQAVPVVTAAADGDELAWEARAAAKLPDCPECLALDVV